MTTPSPHAPPERTPLHGEHLALGASMVDFHGWEMPIRYGSIPEEHQKVRLSAGLFDLSHMGRLEITGRDAVAWVDRVITNDCAALKPGGARYTLLVNEAGGIVEDAIAYRLKDGIFLVVNASNRAAVIDWMEGHQGALAARLDDRSRELAMIAVQGPQAVRILPQVCELEGADWESMKYYSIAEARTGGVPARVARTGYTGEDGFEVYLEAGAAPALWRRLLDAGGNRLAPIGLGARDTLRLEAGMPLYGNDIDLDKDPFEAGLGFAVKLDKPAPFIGREALAQKKQAGPKRRLTGFKVEGRRVARQGMPVVVEPAGGEGTPRPAGVITSGAPSPTLGYPIAMGYLDTSLGEADRTRLAVDVRGRCEPLSLTPLPFYSRTRKQAK